LTDFADALLGIDEAFESRLGSSPGLGAVGSEVYAMARACETFVDAFAEPDAASEASGEGEAAVASAPAGNAAARPVSLGLESVRNRADVVTAMDAIIRYYAENEPASPVPVMLKRVRGWVNKDFLEVMRDIAPAQSEELARLLVSPEY
jgi:type VI secretion system protein ImpA